MLAALIVIVLVALIVGVILWGLSQLPWLDPNIKQLIRVVVVVVFAIWVILRIASMFGLHVPA